MWDMVVECWLCVAFMAKANPKLIAVLATIVALLRIYQ